MLPYSRTAVQPILSGMKRTLVILGLAGAVLAVRPAPALADATAFVGFSPTLATRSTTGFGLGLSFVIVGVEFEYSHLNEVTASGAPGVGAGMINFQVQTPTKTQIYVTAGGGFYHESLGTDGHYNVGFNVGGGIKIKVAGPIRLRIDYRVFTLNQSFVTQHPQRIYFGFNFAF